MHIEPGLLSRAPKIASELRHWRDRWAMRQAGAAGMKTDGAGAVGAHADRCGSGVYIVRDAAAYAGGRLEVHLILGTTLLLMLGVAPAALGLAAGLLVQSLFFAPQDLPQYGMNVTTLLVPLFATAALARRIIPRHRLR